MLHDFKQVTEILADESVVLRQLVAYRPERTAASHFVSLLQVHMSLKPAFQILPGIDFVVEWSIAIFYRCQVALQHIVDQTLFALEVVIELALPGRRSLNDFLGAGSTNSLLVKQIGGHLNNAKFCVRTFSIVGFHRVSRNMYQQVQELR